MIEVRSSYLVKTKDIRDVMALWRHGRDIIWPVLKWQGRIQQMLHGHAQQSLFIWSSQWENMADWEAGMARTNDSAAYKSWSAELNKLRVYGEEREVFRILEPLSAPDNNSGKIEVRSSYLVQMQYINQAMAIMRRGQETVWPVLGWSGQNQQMLHGKAAQSMLVWSSTWESMATWEKAMAQTVDCKEFQDWYKEWLEILDFGGPREVFRNL
jgi:hypothetical protein